MNLKEAGKRIVTAAFLALILIVQGLFPGLV